MGHVGNFVEFYSDEEQWFTIQVFGFLVFIELIVSIHRAPADHICGKKSHVENKYIRKFQFVEACVKCAVELYVSTSVICKNFILY